ncbi:hypothetical protein HN51_039655 [Arachis hypogaea]
MKGGSRIKLRKGRYRLPPFESSNFSAIGSKVCLVEDEVERMKATMVCGFLPNYDGLTTSDCIVEAPWVAKNPIHNSEVMCVSVLHMLKAWLIKTKIKGAHKITIIQEMTSSL